MAESSRNDDVTLAFDRWYVHCSTLGFIGRIKFAPGTFGSLPGILLGIPLYFLFQDTESSLWSSMTLALSLSSIVIVTAFAWGVIALTENYWSAHDRSEIVIDELAGQFIPIILCGTHHMTLIASFVVFRIFDILKPWPVGHIDEKWPGAAGTLFDDIAAGIMTAIVIFCLRPFWL